MGIVRAMADDADPPRKFYGLKPKEFERVNEPAPAGGADDSAAAAAPAPDPGIVGAEPGRIDVRELFQQAATPGAVLRKNPPPSAPAAPSGENDVQAMLRENRARAEAAGLHELAPKPKRRSRRRRDYWVLLIASNAFFAFAAITGRGNPVTFVSAIAGMGLTTAGLTWVMWFIMDDY